MLAEMTLSSSIKFMLDFADTEDGTSTTMSSTSPSATSVCPIDMGFKAYN
jgi:hypothetical protein